MVALEVVRMTLVLRFSVLNHNVQRIASLPASFDFDDALDQFLATVDIDMPQFYFATLPQGQKIVSPTLKQNFEFPSGEEVFLSDLQLQIGDEISITSDFGTPLHMRLQVEDFTPRFNEGSFQLLQADGSALPQFLMDGNEDDEDDDDEDEEEDDYDFNNDIFDELLPQISDLETIQSPDKVMLIDDDIDGDNFDEEGKELGEMNGTIVF